MAGLYGTIRPSNINIENDVEIFYFYRPSRSTDPDDLSGFMSLEPTCLVPVSYDTNETGHSTNNILGLYELRLPLNIFNRKGYYTIYIRPKEVTCTLADVSVLATYPDIKGVVINTDGTDLSSINDLTGYRIDYLGNNVVSDISRLITSCNRCEPVLVTVSDSYPKATRYRLTDTGANNLYFCTVTPSSASSIKPNVTPYIGTPGGSVIISNTKFDPVMLEIEMVDNDIDSIMTMVAGDQVMNRDKAIITTYNNDGDIFMQQDYYTVKDKLGEPLYTVKRKKSTIDTQESYDNRINNI